MGRLPVENVKKFILVFFELLPISNFEIENLTSQNLLHLGASNLDS